MFPEVQFSIPCCTTGVYCTYLSKLAMMGTNANVLGCNSWAETAWVMLCPRLLKCMWAGPPAVLAGQLFLMHRAAYLTHSPSGGSIPFIDHYCKGLALGQLILISCREPRCNQGPLAGFLWISDPLSLAENNPRNITDAKKPTSVKLPWYWVLLDGIQKAFML